MKRPFVIAKYSYSETLVVVAEIGRGGHIGRGETTPVQYLGETIESIIADIEGIRNAIEHGLDRIGLQAAMPPGAARNALDCAFWELESLEAKCPVWQLTGLTSPGPLLSVMTIGADEPEAMAYIAANDLLTARAIKLKLTGDAQLDSDRLRTVRGARPDAVLTVDANRGYDLEGLASLLPALVEYRVTILEQPFERGSEADLESLQLPIPVAADESCLHLADVEAMLGRFDIINIKLDKCGGLTEALSMAARAKTLGLGVMVGNMCGTSLAMAPAFIVGQYCQLVDLDGPWLLARDRNNRVEYNNGEVWCGPHVWGYHSAN
jgi:L-alanine-DL-glutamate epimerase-like enolase superfamily enzyme